MIAVRTYLRGSLLSLLCGLMSGLAAAVFLISLAEVTRLRELHPWLIGLLPAAGLAIAWLYLKLSGERSLGTHLILDEIHDPKKVLPLRMGPLVLASTLLTHLCGGSAGREGTAVQLGASLSDQLTRAFRLGPDERKILLSAGMGAGFGAAVGAPWAGSVFGLEVVRSSARGPRGWLCCLIASWTAYHAALLVGARHSEFAHPGLPAFSLQVAASVALAAVAFGLAAAIFVQLAHRFEAFLPRVLPSSMWRPFAAGILIVLLYWLEGSYRFAGLGISRIQEALLTPASLSAPALKSLFTILTVGSGFKGGEFIPLVYVGTTLGSALSLVLPLSCGFLGALGFAAIFGAAARAPIACAVMACELFGFAIAPYALLACALSSLVAIHPGLYRRRRT